MEQIKNKNLRYLWIDKLSKRPFTLTLDALPYTPSSTH
jgi:hypothetical protein